MGRCLLDCLLLNLPGASRRVHVILNARVFDDVRFECELIQKAWVLDLKSEEQSTEVLEVIRIALVADLQPKLMFTGFLNITALDSQLIDSWHVREYSRIKAVSILSAELEMEGTASASEARQNE